MHQSVLRVMPFLVAPLDLALLLLLEQRWYEVLEPIWPESDRTLLGVAGVEWLAMVLAFGGFGFFTLFFLSRQIADRCLDDDILEDRAETKQMQKYVLAGGFVAFLFAEIVIIYLAFVSAYQNPFVNLDITFGETLAHVMIAATLSLLHVGAAFFSAMAIAMRIQRKTYGDMDGSEPKSDPSPEAPNLNTEKGGSDELELVA